MRLESKVEVLSSDLSYVINRGQVKKQVFWRGEGGGAIFTILIRKKTITKDVQFIVMGPFFLVI